MSKSVPTISVTIVDVFKFQYTKATTQYHILWFQNITRHTSFAHFIAIPDFQSGVVSRSVKSFKLSTCYVSTHCYRFQIKDNGKLTLFPNDSHEETKVSLHKCQYTISNSHYLLVLIYWIVVTENIHWVITVASHKQPRWMPLTLVHLLKGQYPEWSCLNLSCASCL
jgi:hypothetical protein